MRHDPTLSHQHASGLLPTTYTEWNLSGKLKKITQRLYFGYCQEGFREFMGEKCENRGAGVRKIEFVEDRGNLMLCSPSHPATVLPTPDACFAMPSTHKKVIVRKMDRDSVSGYVSPAQIVSEGKVEVLNTSGTVISVDLREIKGVYFVREFGEAESLTRKTFTSRPRAEGLWVRLRFKDSEVLEGLMPADLLQSTPEGYLVNPPDQRSNTQRIFVPRTALESLTVLAVIGTTRRQRRAAEDQRQVPMFEE